jgi:hypothetical protein
MQNATLPFAAIAALIGAVQMLSPDHWMPSSVIAWQRGWRTSRTIRFVAIAVLLHVASGAVIGLCLAWVAGRAVPLSDSEFLLSSVLLVGVASAIRAYRFVRIREVVRAGPPNLWSYVPVLSLLGPSEALVPILSRAPLLGCGFIIPIVAYLAGALGAGLPLVLLARRGWNRPHWLPRGLEWANRRRALLPASLGALAGIGLLLLR